jgi:hypothetical protein
LGGSAAATLTTGVIMSSTRPERAGVVSALAQTGAELGGALGIAVLGSLGTAVYRTMVGAALPEGLAPELAAAARETLGGAVSVAGQLGDPVAAAALVLAAQQALTLALQATSLIATVVSIGTAVAAAVYLRERTEQESRVRAERTVAVLTPCGECVAPQTSCRGEVWSMAKAPSPLRSPPSRRTIIGSRALGRSRPWLSPLRLVVQPDADQRRGLGQEPRRSQPAGRWQHLTVRLPLEDRPARTYRGLPRTAGTTRVMATAANSARIKHISMRPPDSAMPHRAARRRLRGSAWRSVWLAAPLVGHSHVRRPAAGEQRLTRS